MNISMRNEEIQKIESYLNKENIMLEWGSGGSTLYFPQFVKEFISIEHNNHWWVIVDSQIPDNGVVYLVESNLPRTHPTKREEFKDYVEYVHILNRKYDRVLIDGRARLYCAIEVLPYLTDDAIVFVHDWGRSEYDDILLYYDIIEQSRSLMVLRAKKKWEENL
jgi:hypothetical protein